MRRGRIRCQASQSFYLWHRKQATGAEQQLKPFDTPKTLDIPMTGARNDNPVSENLRVKQTNKQTDEKNKETKKQRTILILEER